MRRLAAFIIGVALVLVSFWPQLSLAGASIVPSGPSSVTAGSTIAVKVVASGATFNAFSGTISVSGSVSVTGVSYDTSLIWIGTPGANKTFNGALAGNKTVTSLTIATLTVKGTAQGTGKITVSNAMLSNENSITAGGGTLNITVNRAPTVPGAVAVTSPTNPDQNQAYGVTTVEIDWSAPANGATGYSVLFDSVADSVPPSTVTTTALTASYNNLNLGTYYFHIKAVNADGWGGVTHFKVTINRAVDNGLGAPSVVSVNKLPTFKNDVTTGTVSGFQVSGTSSALTGFTATLALTPPAGIPPEQKLDSPIGVDGSWSVTFDQPIPSGFYKLTVNAYKDQTTTPSSTPVNLELSVANGGTAKLITNADLPQPDLTVKVAGVTFATHRQLYLALAAVLLFGLLLIALAYGGQWLYRRYWVKRHATAGLKDSSKRL